MPRFVVFQDKCWTDYGVLTTSISAVLRLKFLLNRFGKGREILIIKLAKVKSVRISRLALWFFIKVYDSDDFLGKFKDFSFYHYYLRCLKSNNYKKWHMVEEGKIVDFLYFL